MDRLGARLKRHIQRLSRSVTPEPPPDLTSRPEPPTNITPSVAPTSPSSTNDTTTGAPPTGILPILSPQPIRVATAPASTNPPAAGSGASIGCATWTGLKLFVEVLQTGADVFGPLKQAVDAFAEFIGTSMEAHAEYKTLRAELDGLFHDLAGGFGESIPPGMRPSIVNLARGIEQEISFFRRKEHNNALGRYAEASQDADQVLYHCRRIQALLERLTLNANIKIWMLVDEQTTSQCLDKLSPSHAAWYNSAESEEIFRDKCTPDTRLEVLERFRVWQDNSQSEKVYWLNGMAGTGKTTLAYTLCKQLEDDNRLAANFFCTRQLPSCRDAKLILRTIAYQLANFSYPFRYALSQILGQNRDVHTRRIRNIQHSLPCGLVVVIDGLDECENERGVGEILDALLNHVSDLPIKFFLTSRPDPAIRGRMLRREGDRDRFELHLHELDKGVVREDVKKYLQSGLEHPDFTLSDEHLEILTDRSGALFIYAATVVRYISVDDFSRSDDRLKDVLEATTGPNESDQGISSLYNLILKRAFERPHLIARDRDEMRLVLETVICAQEPLTVRVVTGVLGLKGERSVHAALGLLRSVFNVQKDETITTLHKSFPDHMLDSTRLLLWMEVLNLTKFMQFGVEMPSQTNPPEWGPRTEWSMVTEAVAVAISLQQYHAALEWFEQGRSILWGQTLLLQTPYDSLYSGNLELLKELQRVLYQPKYAGILQPAEQPPTPDGGSPHNDTWKHRLAERRKELLDFARLLPRLEETLCPPKAPKLVSLVQDGAAVIVNLDRDRCDALVIQTGTQGITHVPLVGFSIQKADDAQAKSGSCLRVKDRDVEYIMQWEERETEYRKALAGLWCDAVKPVLDHLGITQIVPVDDLPHITWCTTSLLSFPPLHAAGDYNSPSAVLSNLAISSYTPTISSLSQRTSSPDTFSGILLIMQGKLSIRGSSFIYRSAGPGGDPIPTQANCLPVTRLGEEALADTVLNKMANHSWVHLDCNVSQGTFDPKESALHLYDRDLKLARLVRNPTKNAQLACLPSYETPPNHYEPPDGTLPLAVGLLMAGYPAAIALMWPTNPQMAELVFKKVYECLLEGGVPDSRKAAKALHQAVAILRERVGVHKAQVYALSFYYSLWGPKGLALLEVHLLQRGEIRHLPGVGNRRTATAPPSLSRKRAAFHSLFAVYDSFKMRH
ncbi:hypothetical protein FRC10_008764 [Ceratobasidium sp. 414]|nr:hypothetical protein FRC10_008764 [Ceratobasidium sp. 414]